MRDIPTLKKKSCVNNLFIAEIATAKSKQFHKYNTWAPQNPSNNDEDNLNILFPNT